MSQPDKEHIPGELQDVASRLRSERPEATALELDRAKLRAMQKASPGGALRRLKPRLLKSPLATMAVAAGLLVAGGGALAATGTTLSSTGTTLSSGSSAGSAATIEYRCKPKPPKGPPPKGRCIRP